jgi:hypothetical protein
MVQANLIHFHMSTLAQGQRKEVPQIDSPTTPPLRCYVPLSSVLPYTPSSRLGILLRRMLLVITT